MKKLGKIHLYLGVFFAPLIMFYSVSGAWQVFGFHRSLKDGSYTAPHSLWRLSSVHQWQRATSKPEYESLAINALKYFSFAMAAGLAIMAVIGIVLAFQRTPKKKRWIPATAFIAGIVIPAAFAFIQLL